MQMHAQELYTFITLKKTKYYNYDVNSYAHNEFSERFPPLASLLQNMRNRCRPRWSRRWPWTSSGPAARGRSAGGRRPWPPAAVRRRPVPFFDFSSRSASLPTMQFTTLIHKRQKRCQCNSSTSSNQKEQKEQHSGFQRGPPP